MVSGLVLISPWVNKYEGHTNGWLIPGALYLTLSILSMATVVDKNFRIIANANASLKRNDFTSFL